MSSLCSVTQLCPTPCGPMDCSLPGSSGIFQERILGQVAISSFRGSFRPRDRTYVSCVSCIGRRILYHWCHLGSPMASLVIRKRNWVRLNQYLLTSSVFFFFSSNIAIAQITYYWSRLCVKSIQHILIEQMAWTSQVVGLQLEMQRCHTLSALEELPFHLES